MTTASFSFQDGLIEQAHNFVAEHPGTSIVVIDTLEHIRSGEQNSNLYACDYRDMNRLREITNRHALTLLLIHHTRIALIRKQFSWYNPALSRGWKYQNPTGKPGLQTSPRLLTAQYSNELDWWIASQREDMPTHYPYQRRFNKAGAEIKSHTYRALRRSRLKEMHIVRYADDFKIFCRSHSDAVRAFEATRLWLKDRLGLEISP